MTCECTVCSTCAAGSGSLLKKLVSVVKAGRSFEIGLVITTSPAAARKWKEEQEAAHNRASFYTIVCKSRADADGELQKLQKLQ